MPFSVDDNPTSSTLASDVISELSESDSAVYSEELDSGISGGGVS